MFNVSAWVPRQTAEQYCQLKQKLEMKVSLICLLDQGLQILIWSLLWCLRAWRYPSMESTLDDKIEFGLASLIRSSKCGAGRTDKDMPSASDSDLDLGVLSF